MSDYPRDAYVEATTTSKLLLKRFLHIQRVCEAALEWDEGKVAPPALTDRAWLADSILNILKGNTDDFA